MIFSEYISKQLFNKVILGNYGLFIYMISTYQTNHCSILLSRSIFPLGCQFLFNFSQVKERSIVRGYLIFLSMNVLTIMVSSSVLPFLLFVNDQ